MDTDGSIPGHIEQGDAKVKCTVQNYMKIDKRKRFQQYKETSYLAWTWQLYPSKGQIFRRFCKDRY